MGNALYTVISIVLLVVVVALFVFVQVGTLYVLIQERRLGRIRRHGSSALAVRRRWFYAISGTLSTLVGLALLVAPGTSTELRLAGAILMAWGLVAIITAVLAFRIKPWLADPTRTR